MKLCKPEQFPEIPEKLVKMMRVNSKWRTIFFKKIEDGNRNETVFKFGCYCRSELDIDFDKLEEVLQQYNQVFCPVPLSNYEVTNCAKSAGSYETPLKEKKDSNKVAINKVIEYILAKTKFFHTEDKSTYAKIKTENNIENIVSTQSRDFRLFLMRILYKDFNASGKEAIIKELVANLESIALFDSLKEKVFVRVGSLNDDLYIDLGSDDHSVIKINRSGEWINQDYSPVNFIRPQGMSELPRPERCQDISLLRTTLFSGWTGSDSFFPLILTWIIKTLTYDTGPYPILALLGEQGSGKTWLSRCIRVFTDPNESSLRTYPEKVEDIILAARNGHVIALDNLSNITYKIADVCCTISTGGSFTTRRLYTNEEEFSVKVLKPILLNGINMPTNRADFQERTICIDLPRITTRKTEKKLKSEFEKSKNKIMGVLLFVLAQSYKVLDEIKIDSPPRMADFAQWGEAISRVIGLEENRFLELYAANQQELSNNSLEDSLLATALLFIMRDRKAWSGRSTDLLREIRQIDTLNDIHRNKFFPASPESIGKELKRLSPILRRNGYEVTKRKRFYEIKNMKYKETSINLNNDHV